MSLAELLADLVVFVALPLNWLAATLQWRLSNIVPAIRVLRERAVAATALSLIVTIFALIFLNNDQPVPLLNGEVTKLLTRGTILIFSTIPALYWLRLWWQAR